MDIIKCICVCVCLCMCMCKYLSTCMNVFAYEYVYYILVFSKVPGGAGFPFY